MARARISGRTFVKFTVDSSDVKKELRKLCTELPKEVLSSVNGSGTPNKIVKNMESRLTAKYDAGSKRIKKVKEAIGMKKSLKQLANSAMSEYTAKTRSLGTVVPGKPLVSSRKIKGAMLGIGHKPTLDKKTLIATLDRTDRPRHKGPTTAPKDQQNLPKAIGAPSSYKYSLWQILEMRKKQTYPIRAIRARSLAYTTQKDSYATWRRGRTVTWMAGAKASQNAYFMLNQMRRMYLSDVNYFVTGVVRGVQRYLKTKSRFKR